MHQNVVILKLSFLVPTKQPLKVNNHYFHLQIPILLHLVVCTLKVHLVSKELFTYYNSNYRLFDEIKDVLV